MVIGTICTHEFVIPACYPVPSPLAIPRIFPGRKLPTARLHDLFSERLSTSVSTPTLVFHAQFYPPATLRLR